MNKFINKILTLKLKDTFKSFIVSFFMLLLCMIAILIKSLLKCYTLGKRFIIHKPGLFIFIFIGALVVQHFIIHMSIAKSDIRQDEIYYRQTKIIDSLTTDVGLYKQLYNKEKLRSGALIKRDSIRNKRNVTRVRPNRFMLKDSVLQHKN